MIEHETFIQGGGSDLSITVPSIEQATRALVTSTALNGAGTYTWVLTDPHGVNQDGLLSSTTAISVTWTPNLWGTWYATCTDGTVTVTQTVDVGGAATAGVDLDALTLSNDIDGIISGDSATQISYANVTGSNNGQNWPRWEDEDLVANTLYSVSVWDLAPATNRRGCGSGFIDDNQMYFVGIFNSATAREVFVSFGPIGAPTEILVLMTNASITGVRFHFYVGTDGDVALHGSIDAIDDDGKIIATNDFGTATNLLAPTNARQCHCARRGTTNGTTTMNYKIEVVKSSPPNV